MTYYFEILFIFLGCFFCLTAALGVLRFPDFYSRMHSAGKVSTFGVGFFLLALVAKYPQQDVLIKSMLCLAFIFLTAPLASHILMRAAYLLKTPYTSKVLVDEYISHVSSVNKKR